MPLDSTHPYGTAPVLLAKTRALIPWCATAPTLLDLAKTLDDFLDEFGDIDGAYDVMKLTLGTSCPSDHLADTQYLAMKSCGEEPYAETVQVRCAVHGISMDERGDGAAWERWNEAVDAAQQQAGRKFRASMAAMLRALEGALLKADARVPA